MKLLEIAIWRSVLDEVGTEVKIELEGYSDHKPLGKKEKIPQFNEP